MKKKAKIKLLVALSFILSGFILFVGTMMALKWDFKKLQTVKYETKRYTITESFESISIVASTADVAIVSTEEATASVVCYEKEKVNNSVAVKNGVLTVEETDSRKWYQRFSLGFEQTTVTVYLPKAEYALVSVELSTGDITLQNLQAASILLSVSTGTVSVSETSCAGDFWVSVSTGEMKLRDVTCKNFTSEGSTGDIELYNVLVSEKMKIERSTGDVEFSGCDAAEIFIETSTGDVGGTLLSPKQFIVETSTGEIDVPKNTMGGRCQINTSTGDVEIAVR